MEHEAIASAENKSIPSKQRRSMSISSVKKGRKAVTSNDGRKWWKSRSRCRQKNKRHKWEDIGKIVIRQIRRWSRKQSWRQNLVFHDNSFLGDYIGHDIAQKRNPKHNRYKEKNRLLWNPTEKSINSGYTRRWKHHPPSVDDRSLHLPLECAPNQVQTKVDSPRPVAINSGFKPMLAPRRYAK